MWTVRATNLYAAISLRLRFWTFLVVFVSLFFFFTGNVSYMWITPRKHVWCDFDVWVQNLEIIHGFSNKNLLFSCISITLIHFLIKERRKSDNLSLKSFFWTSEQTFATQFLPVSCNVCPVAIPKNLCANTRIQWLATHSLIFSQSGTA